MEIRDIQSAIYTKYCSINNEVALPLPPCLLPLSTWQTISTALAGTPEQLGSLICHDTLDACGTCAHTFRTGEMLELTAFPEHSTNMLHTRF